MGRSRCVPLALVAIAGTVLAACDQAHVADPAGQDYVRMESAGLLAACQLNPEVEFTGTAGIAGGTLAGGGVSMTIPAGALSKATSFHIRIPSSPYAEVEIHADGLAHYQFMLPVVIAIEYSRCGTPSGNLAVWHIDPETKALLENMGGVNDVVHRRMIFSTMHLSG